MFGSMHRRFDYCQNIQRNSSPVRAMLIALCFAILCCASATRALADDPGLPPPPVSQIIDSNGVNLTTGVWRPVGPGATIGQANQGALGYVVNQSETDYWNSTVKSAVGSSHYTVTLLGEPEAFTLSGATFTPDYFTGGSLTFDGTNYTYTKRNGDVAVFPATTFTCSSYCTVGLIRTLTYASGESLNFTFRTATGFTSLLSINSNLGYQIKVTYKSDDPSSPNWYEIDHVTAINNTVDWCDPTVDGCSGLTQTWPTLSFSTVSGVEHMIDTMGHTTLLSHTAVGTVVTTTYQFPAGDQVSVSQDQCVGCDPGVFTYTNNNGTWGYSIEASGSEIDTTVTGSGSARYVVSDAATGIIKSDTLDYGGTNPLTTIYENDGVHITKVTYPENNVRKLTYDSRGNLIEVRDISKTPGTPLDVVWSAAYPASCDSSNFRVCNKPTSITDPNLNTTSYTYDSNSGNVLTITGPSVNGGQAQTRYSYTAVSAWYKQDSSGAITVAPTQVYKITAVSKCLLNAGSWNNAGASNWGAFLWSSTGFSTGSCLSSNQENKTTTVYPSGSSTLATNVLPSQTTVASGSGSISITTSQTYDGYSNTISQTGPNPGNTSVVFYDLDRRAIGTVGPNPGGGLQNPATRTTYDYDGKVTEVETGYAPSQSFSDWQNNFTSVLQNSTAYNSLSGLKISDSAAVGGVTQSVTQYTFDGNDNLSCTAVRQDPSYFSSLPTSACDQSGTPPYGSFGADMITHYTYDGANRLLTTQSGYNTSGVTSITLVTNSYTNNSKIASVQDANGNQSAYTYDGLDHMVKLNFPDPSTHIPNSADYETYGYDPNGNMISKRLRSGDTVSYSYDAMNRQTVKSFSGGSTTSVYTGYDLSGDVLSVHYSSAGGLTDILYQRE
jgi:YD repeat-containing protein